MRLTDEEIEYIRRAFPTHLGEPKHSVLIQRLVAELREHRAAALTDEEREALEWLRDVFAGVIYGVTLPEWRTKHDRALAVLDRLLAGGKP
jgi:hypothetical protein